MSQNDNPNSRQRTRLLNRTITLALVGVVIAIGSLTALTFLHTMRSGNSFAAHSAAQAQNHVVVADHLQPEKLEVVLVTLRRDGFEPSELTHPHRPFRLMVQNRSGLAQVSFRFDGTFAKRVKARNAPPVSEPWGGIVDLPPGTYRVSEATHPEWTFSLTIKKND